MRTSPPYVALYHEPKARTAIHPLENRLQETFAPLGINVRLITTDDVHQGTFSTDPHLILFVLPGITGYDCAYRELIGQEGAAHIKNYLERGGAVLNICAGGYHSGRDIAYQRTCGTIVTKDALLDLFPYTAYGPVYEDETKTIPLRFKNLSGQWEKTGVAYHSGPALKVDQADIDSGQVEIIAHYDIADMPIALAKRKTGNGLAIFSGPHIEIHPPAPEILACYESVKGMQKLVNLSRALKPHAEGLTHLWNRVINDIITHNVQTGRLLPETQALFTHNHQLKLAG